MNYHVTLNAHEGPLLRLFWLTVDATQPMAWVLATLTGVVGFFLFRKTWPYVANAWSDVDTRLRESKP